jgi:hypothetical protein
MESSLKSDSDSYCHGRRKRIGAELTPSSPARKRVIPAKAGTQMNGAAKYITTQIVW